VLLAGSLSRGPRSAPRGLDGSDASGGGNRVRRPRPSRQDKRESSNQRPSYACGQDDASISWLCGVVPDFARCAGGRPFVRARFCSEFGLTSVMMRRVSVSSHMSHKTIAPHAPVCHHRFVIEIFPWHCQNEKRRPWQDGAQSHNRNQIFIPAGRTPEARRERGSVQAENCGSGCSFVT
jgi:hypothetical protein